jgi:serine/threonine protein kinase
METGWSVIPSSSSKRLGYRGEDKGPRSLLYCAPEEFVNVKYPYAFDMYGIAATWIRTVLYDERRDDDTSTAVKDPIVLGNEDELFKWRLDVRNFDHNLLSWEEYATLHDALPIGWDDLFGSSRRGIHAMRLLSNLMSYSPQDRISAAEALVGPYLNPECDAAAPPELPPVTMPYSLLSHLQRWHKDREVKYGECQLDDLITRVVSVEVNNWPIPGIQLESNSIHRQQDGVKQIEGSNVRVGVVGGGGGVRVHHEGTTTVRRSDDGTIPTSVLHNRDCLLAIGSIDVEDASVEHVLELLHQWPTHKPITMLLIRDA